MGAESGLKSYVDAAIGATVPYCSLLWWQRVKDCGVAGDGIVDAALRRGKFKPQRVDTVLDGVPQRVYSAAHVFEQSVGYCEQQLEFRA
jgi:hypothetical protein